MGYLSSPSLSPSLRDTAHQPACPLCVITLQPFYVPPHSIPLNSLSEPPKPARHRTHRRHAAIAIAIHAASSDAVVRRILVGQPIARRVFGVGVRLEVAHVRQPQHWGRDGRRDGRDDGCRRIRRRSHDVAQHLLLVSRLGGLLDPLDALLDDGVVLEALSLVADGIWFGVLGLGATIAIELVSDVAGETRFLVVHNDADGIVFELALLADGVRLLHMLRHTLPLTITLVTFLAFLDGLARDFASANLAVRVEVVGALGCWGHLVEHDTGAFVGVVVLVQLVGVCTRRRGALLEHFGAVAVGMGLVTVWADLAGGLFFVLFALVSVDVEHKVVLTHQFGLLFSGCLALAVDLVVSGAARVVWLDHSAVHTLAVATLPAIRAFGDGIDLDLHAAVGCIVSRVHQLPAGLTHVGRHLIHREGVLNDALALVVLAVMP
mmetsp:Transcript_35769/g.89057  ORF Transcript_35769/g.89057 Transcript_35769/m.89057 type:complete len:435 (-) Transcript_35769:1297-2601(-)